MSWSHTEMVTVWLWLTLPPLRHPRDPRFLQLLTTTLNRVHQTTLQFLFLSLSLFAHVHVQHNIEPFDIWRTVKVRPSCFHQHNIGCLCVHRFVLLFVIVSPNPYSSYLPLKVQRCSRVPVPQRWCLCNYLQVFSYQEFPCVPIRVSGYPSVHSLHSYTFILLLSINTHFFYICLFIRNIHLLIYLSFPLTRLLNICLILYRRLTSRL